MTRTGGKEGGQEKDPQGAGARNTALHLETAAIERRREPRHAAQGVVSIFRAGAPPPEITARLVDISASGFRAAHTCATLRAGEIVRFSHASSAGQARVVWTRVLSVSGISGAESGFVVLAES